MKINWINVLEQAIAAIIASVILASLAYIYQKVAGNPQANFWLGIGGISFVIIMLAAFVWRTFQRLLTLLGQWLIRNWRLLVGWLLIWGTAYGNFWLTGSLLSIAFTLGLVAGIVFLIKIPSSAPQRHFYPIPLPLGTVVNASLHKNYSAPPLGEIYFNGIRFYIAPEAYMFDTSEARYIESNDTVKAELELSEPMEVESVHLLINAGGGFRIDSGSRAVLEWLKIGKVRLLFKDTSYQDTELILGDNIREWAIGNFPGEVVDRVDDRLSQVVWRGKNREGNYAVIDRLEIPIQETHKKKLLKSIIFIRDIPWKALPSEGGKVHFFVSALTLESSVLNPKYSPHSDFSHPPKL